MPSGCGNSSCFSWQLAQPTFACAPVTFLVISSWQPAQPALSCAGAADASASIGRTVTRWATTPIKLLSMGVGCADLLLPGITFERFTVLLVVLARAVQILSALCVHVAESARLFC